MSNRCDTDPSPAVLYRVNRCLYLPDQFGRRNVKLTIYDYKLDRPAAVPYRIYLYAPNAVHRIDPFFVICNISAERLSVHAVKIPLTQRICVFLVLSWYNKFYELCRFQSFNVIYRQNRSNIIVANRSRRLAGQAVSAVTFFLAYLIY